MLVIWFAMKWQSYSFLARVKQLFNCLKCNTLELLVQKMGLTYKTSQADRKIPSPRKR